MSDLNTTPVDTQQRVISKRSESKGRKAVSENYAQLERLAVTYVDVGLLNPNYWNPNRQSEREFEILLRSMEDHGFTTPILVSTVPLVISEEKAVQFYGQPMGTEIQNVIIDGEHRWRGAQVLGFQEIPVVYADMSPEQAMSATMQQNIGRGSHDIQLEADLLRDLEKLGALDTVTSSLMMSDVEVQRLLDDVPTTELFANEEFSEAWVPGDASSDKTGIQPSIEAQETEAGIVTASTARSIKVQRARETALKKAKTDEERAMAMQDNDIFRLSLVFAGDEASLVRKGLGQKPAQTIMGWCEERVDGTDDEPGNGDGQ